MTDIKALQGNIGETKFVLGFLSQLAEGQYGLEDLSGSVVVDLRETTRTAGLFTGMIIQTLQSLPILCVMFIQLCVMVVLMLFIMYTHHVHTPCTHI